MHIVFLHRRRGNIEAQGTRVLNSTEGKAFNVSQWKDLLKFLAKAEEKVEVIVQEYY